MESKILKLIVRVEWWLPAFGIGKVMKCLSKFTKFQLCKIYKFWRSNIVTIVNNTVLHTFVYLKFANRVDLKWSHHKNIRLTI